MRQTHWDEETLYQVSYETDTLGRGDSLPGEFETDTLGRGDSLPSEL